MTIAKKIDGFITKSSWIRKMFEEGARLKAAHGANTVFDFSLGNPNVPPPECFNQQLIEAVTTCGPDGHCYMPNTGYPQVCRAIADYLSTEQQVAVSGREIIMTCGAAGALNVVLKTLLDPGDEGPVPGAVFRRIRVLCRQPRRGAQDRAHPGRFHPRSGRHGGRHRRPDQGGADQFAQQPHRPGLRRRKSDQAGRDSAAEKRCPRPHPLPGLRRAPTARSPTMASRCRPSLPFMPMR